MQKRDVLIVLYIKKIIHKIRRGYFKEVFMKNLAKLISLIMLAAFCAFVFQACDDSFPYHGDPGIIDEGDETGGIEEPTQDIISEPCREWNAAVLDFAAVLDGGYYTFIVTVVNNVDDEAESDKDLVVRLEYITEKDGSGYTLAAKTAPTRGNDGIPVQVIWETKATTAKVAEFYSATVSIINCDEDSNPLDNTMTIMSAPAQPCVFLVSDSPVLIRSVLLGAGCAVDLSPSGGVNDIPEGYDIYVFDGIAPPALPESGAVWLINAPFSLHGLGFETVTLDGLTELISAESTGPAYELIMKYGVNGNGNSNLRIQVSEYMRIIGLSELEAVLYCGEDPVLLAGEVEGRKIIVLAFSLSMSNLPMLVDFPLLVYNLTQYSLN